MQCSLIWEFMLYKFKLSHDDAEVTKNNFYIKGESPVNHSTVAKCLKRFCLGCKNLYDQANLKP